MKGSQQLPGVSYTELVKALKKRFELDAMKELYMAEFQSRKKPKD